MMKLDMFVLEMNGEKDCSRIYLDQASADIGMNERYSETDIVTERVKIVKISAISYVRESKKVEAKA